MSCRAVSLAQIGGSCYVLENGNYLVGWTAAVTNTGHYDQSGDMLLFEVDHQSQPANAMVLPDCGTTRAQGGYRMTPWRSIRGESSHCPLDDQGGTG